MTPFEFGIIAGIVWASILIVWSLAEITTGEPSPWLLLVCIIYEGFDLSPKGILIGGLWAFADGFISGYILGWLAGALF